MSGGYQQAIRESIPHAEICFDPFHVVRLAPARGRPGPPRRVERPRPLPHPRRASGSRAPAGRCSKSPEKQTIDQLAKLGEVQQANKPLYRAFLLKEELRLLYHLDDPRSRPSTSTPGSTWASRSRLEPFVKLARTIRRHRDGILAAIRLGLDNGRLEGLNSRIRLISHRSFGFHSAAPLIALIYLCCTGIVIPLPR